MSQRVLVLTQYYPPDTVGSYTADLCAHWAAKGHRVTVVTATPSYSGEPIRAPAEETLDGVHVLRVSLPLGSGRGGIRERLQGYAQYQRGAARIARRLVAKERFDAVVAVSTPPLIGLTAASLARRTKARFAYVLHDIHPDIVAKTGGFRLPPAVFRTWDRLHRRALKAAWRVAVVTEGMRQTLIREKGVGADKVRVVPLYGRPEMLDLEPSRAFAESLGLGDTRLLVLYGGNMGLMHPLDPLLDAAARLKKDGIGLVFVGGGVRKAYVRERIEREGLDNVRCLGRLPDEEYRSALASADVCVVPLEPGVERLASPSRAYTFLSAGKPLLALMSPEADLAREALEEGFGWLASDAESIVKLLQHITNHPEERSQAGEAARQAYRERYATTVVLGKYDESFDL